MEGEVPTKYADNDYMEKHQVHELFADLLTKLAVQQPENPIGFMIRELELPNAPRTICVFGPPGAGKSRLCASLAEKLGIVHISTSQLLLNSATDEIRAAIVSGALVPDALVSPLVVDAIRQPAAARTGWVLDHFPATPAQAFALQQAGVVPTKFIFLDVPETVSRARLESNEQTAHLSAAQVTTALREHTENVNSMVDYFKDLVFYIDATLPPSEIDTRAVEYINTPVFGADARVPHRILLLGPVGSGKTLHAARLAETLRVEHISTSQLLKHAATQNSPDAALIKRALAAGQLVPDAIVLPLLRARLEQYDVRRSGFVLDGCPRTAAQAQFFAAIGVRPSRVAVLEASDDAIEARLLGMRADTVTRSIYCIRGGCVSMQPPANVHHRLAPIAVKPPSFRDAQTEYRRHIAAVRAEFGRAVREFDACAPIEDVQAQLAKFIKYPLK